MAGIKEALKRVSEERNRGTVLALGQLKECTCDDQSGCHICESNTTYMIVELDHDKGFITVYDYGSDIYIDPSIQLQDKVILQILDNYSATWKKLDTSELGVRSSTKHCHMTAKDYCEKQRNKFVGQKVWVYDNARSDTHSRVGYVVGSSHRFNSSFTIAFDTPTGIKKEDIHDELLRGEDGEYFSWVNEDHEPIDEM